MNGYNPEELAEEANRAESGELEGTIVDIEETTAQEIYGEAAEDPDRAQVIVTVALTDDVDRDLEEFTDNFSLPLGPRSWRNTDFKLGKFRRKYGELPTEGMTVNVGLNRKGYYRMAL